PRGVITVLAPSPEPPPTTDQWQSTTISGGGPPLTTAGPPVNHRSTVVDRQPMAGQRWPRSSHMAADVA
ncbi:hypothetical protein Tco_1471305, partial [Tanacetum coccineum]